LFFNLQLVANETALPVDEVELWSVLKPQTNIVDGERTVDPDRDNLRVLDDQETLAELMRDYENTSYGYLVKNLKVDYYHIHKYLLFSSSHCYSAGLCSLVI
jgi:hypothetical protein